MIGQILEYNTVVTKAEFLFMIQSVNLPLNAHTITSSAHCSTLQPSATCSQPSSAHTAANLQCTLQPCTAMYSYLQPTFSAHCSYTIQCTSSAHTAAAITSSVNTAAMYSHVQLSAANLQCTLQPSTTIYTAAILSSAHCSCTIQCTLQLYHPVHTAATLSIQCIQCTSGPPQGKPIPLLAYLQSSQQTLMVDCSSP